MQDRGASGYHVVCSFLKKRERQGRKEGRKGSLLDMIRGKKIKQFIIMD